MQPESTITHRNRERIIKLFQCESTIRLKLDLNRLNRYAQKPPPLLTNAHCYANFVDNEKRSPSENAILYRPLVDLY